MKKAAIVSDGLWRKSLSAIRSLGKANYAVHVMGDSIFTTGFWSRYTTERIICPVAKDNPEKFGSTLIKNIRKLNEKPVIFPMEDASLIWVVDHWNVIKDKAYGLFPPLESLRIAEDKSATMKTAEKIGIPIPKTIYPRSYTDFVKKLENLFGRNFLVKPVSGSGSAGIIYLSAKKNIDWKTHWNKYGPLIIQERISENGKAQGVSLLFDKSGTCKAYFAHERLQQYPNSGGPSTDRVSISANNLVNMSVKLLKHLNWVGVAMVEWKVDPKTNIPKLMEINPRFWGSLELAVRSGVDFPVLYAKAAMGKKLPDPPKYKTGVRCRWLIPGDMLRFLTQNKQKRESLWKFLSGLPTTAEEWDTKDLFGFFSAAICTVVQALNPKYWKYVRRG